MFDPDHDAYLADLHAHPEDETEYAETAAGTTGDPDVSGGGVPHLPVTPPPHPIG